MSCVIKSWGTRATQRFAEEAKSKFSGLNKVLALRRLKMLDEAETLGDLVGLASIGLHKLSGDRKGQWAISAGGRWRIIFEFHDGHAWNVEIVDYH
ncbi:MAG: type II toxin-antitoxin system RelE/ParE family toxin [Proteobacteria bacterium]|nr:type II toxin-antitoxin system RelE/ParE family toxin [Pseudomonadota bacterium]MBI3498233.1 type II toxin-antitoxin system RelE/ParE family toxin [Pseudomonadota bacterium]